MAGTKLLPCPFCGGEPDEYEGEYGNGIYCMECGAMVGEPIHLGFNIAERVSYEQAAKAWNTRADFHGYEQSVIEAWSSIKAYQERTCYDRNASAREHGAHLFMWRCSNCDESYDTEMDKLNYCPNCGARVTPKNSETTPKVVSE